MVVGRGGVPLPPFSGSRHSDLRTLLSSWHTLRGLPVPWGPVSSEESPKPPRQQLVSMMWTNSLSPRGAGQSPLPARQLRTEMLLVRLSTGDQGPHNCSLPIRHLSQ